MIRLVTWFESPSLGHTRAFDATSGKELEQFARHNSRPSASARRAIKAAGLQVTEELFGEKWLPFGVADDVSDVRCGQCGGLPCECAGSGYVLPAVSS